MARMRELTVRPFIVSVGTAILEDMIECGWSRWSIAAFCICNPVERMSKATMAAVLEINKLVVTDNTAFADALCVRARINST